MVICIPLVCLSFKFRLRKKSVSLMFVSVGLQYAFVILIAGGWSELSVDDICNLYCVFLICYRWQTLVIEL